LLIIGYTYVKDRTVWPIKSVQITTELKHVHSALVQEIVTPYIADSFFTVRTGALQQELEQLPWVEAVSIERVWPETLRIAVHEKKPVLRWKQTGLISSERELFYPEENYAANLPRLSGYDTYYNEVVDVFLRLNAALAEVDLSIVALDLSPRLAWSMLLSNGLHLYLGQYDIDKRLTRFIQAADKLELQQAQEWYVDLRYTNGFALGKKKS
ncbi:MAG TPA: FtsQ-type POTRA domain-containing protein, partial [Gammaproteobacteria bacterium]|nr:FtsQ-type POTRA domain-containing protein [Gammaproteobacteria bacterium]